MLIGFFSVTTPYYHYEVVGNVKLYFSLKGINIVIVIPK